MTLGQITMQWLQKLFRKKNSLRGIVGISFLPYGMTIAVSNYTENNDLKLIHCEFVEVKKTDDYSVILKQWFIAHNLDDHDCYLVLDINDYQRINIETPAVPVNEMRLAIRWKINDFIAFPIDDAMIDYYPVPALNGNNTSLEVIVCPNAIITPLIERCTQAGLSLKVIDIQETTLRNLATLLPNNAFGVAILYLQQSSGIILIQKNGVIYAARKIAIGYEELDLENPFSTNILAGMEHDKLMLEIHPFLTDSLILRAHDNLALEIQRSLDYVRGYYNMGSISELAIIPWGVGTKNLVDKLTNFYGMTAYLMDLSVIMNGDIIVDYATQSLCAPVIGATLRNTVVAIT